jgi:hypothetical protein
VSSIKYLKKTILTIGTRQFDSDNIDIDYLVEFEDSEEPNVAEISLWNPSNDTISQIKREMPVILNSGYVGDIGVLISGKIADFEVISYDVDRELKMYVGDGLEVWNTPIKKSYINLNADKVAQDLSKLSGVSFKIDLEKNITYPQIVFDEPLISCLRKIASDTESKFFIRNGQGFLVKKTYAEQSIFVLNAESGLIGRPERVNIDDIDGYRIQCLLEYRINVGSYVRIESRYVNGDFRVVKGKHADVTEMEVVPL